MTAPGSLPEFLNNRVLKYKGSRCLIWPFGRDQKGYARIRPKRSEAEKSVSSIVCESTHGPRPSKAHWSLHACGKGHLGCVSPQHIYWGTAAHNSDDQRRHGTILKGSRNPQSKLSEADVKIIKELRRKRLSAPKTPVEELAARFSVCKTTILNAAAGRTYGS